MVDHVSIRQRRLASVLRATSGTIHIDDAMRALDIDRAHAAKLLAGWHKQGAIRRIARGLYVPIMPSALGQTQVLEDYRQNSAEIPLFHYLSLLLAH